MESQWNWVHNSPRSHWKCLKATFGVEISKVNLAHKRLGYTVSRFRFRFVLIFSLRLEPVTNEVTQSGDSLGTEDYSLWYIYLCFVQVSFKVSQMMELSPLPLESLFHSQIVLTVKNLFLSPYCSFPLFPKVSSVFLSKAVPNMQSETANHLVSGFILKLEICFLKFSVLYFSDKIKLILFVPKAWVYHYFMEGAITILDLVG